MDDSGKLSLSGDQVARIAGSGVKLLSDDSRVNVPPSMARSGDYGLLISLLSALASGQVVLANPQPKEGLQIPIGRPDDAPPPPKSGNGSEEHPQE